MVTAGEERPTRRSDHSVTSRTRHTASFRGRADLESIRSLNRSDAIDSDHSLDAREFLRLRFGPWPRTRTTRPFFKFSCSNGSTAPGTWPDFTCCRSNRRSSMIWRLCVGGVASGPWGVSGSTCTRPGRSRRSSSRNGSIARGDADTSSAPERRRPALGCRNIREGGVPHKRAKLLSLYHALVLTSARRTRSAGRTMHSELNANRHRPPARSYDSDNRQGLRLAMSGGSASRQRQ